MANPQPKALRHELNLWFELRGNDNGNHANNPQTHVKISTNMQHNATQKLQTFVRKSKELK